MLHSPSPWHLAYPPNTSKQVLTDYDSSQEEA